MRRNLRNRHRLERAQSPSLRPWSDSQHSSSIEGTNRVVDCGWGRLIFGQTFKDSSTLAEVIADESPGKRDIAMYLRNPHVVISLDPQGVFLDPSHTFRLWLDRYRTPSDWQRGVGIRRMNSRRDAESIHDLYVKQHMAPPDVEFLVDHRSSRILTYFVAVRNADRAIVGAVLGVDHKLAFGDPENGSSLWALAVDSQAQIPGIGELLVRHLAEHYHARGRAFMDLSVMHDNAPAISLYKKLGFIRVPVFSLKHKNPFNEPLYIADAPEQNLNPYARIIINEARRRGIAIEVLDEEANYFSLSFGGRSIVCRESLSELTTAIAMSRCDDKRVTHRVLKKTGLRVPEQMPYTDLAGACKFLDMYKRVVVKPARGEQGVGISVDIRDCESLHDAVESARRVSSDVILEEFVEGEDLRIIVINFRVVAAAVRRAPSIIGTGKQTVEELIRKQSRRRAAQTGGESKIPLDSETRRCVQEAGYDMNSTLTEGVELVVRKAANLHTGGTIHDATDTLHPRLCDAAIRAAKALDIPVVGLDFLVPSVHKEEYVIVEANERPGLANHEPQPTAERFIDLLFPQTVSNL